MDLNKIAIEARLRTPWEAIDLGFVMAKHWFKPLFISWLVPSLITVFVFSIFFHNQLWVVLLLTWWLKPLFDRAPLYFASQALFGKAPTTLEVLRAFPNQCKTDFIPWLTIRRLNYMRSFDLPITQLEQLKGNRRLSRLHILHHNNSRPASWLTIVCVHLELFVSLGVTSLILLLIPDEIDFNIIDWLANKDSFSEILTYLLTYASMVLIAPFYTMAGFALYINRRIELEAWDVEIRFRHIANSQKSNKPINVATMAIILLIPVTTTLSQPTLAQNSSLNDAPIQISNNNKPTSINIENTEDSKQLISNILDSKSFHNRVTSTKWRLKGKNDKETSDKHIPHWIIVIIEFLEKFISEKKTNENNNSFIEYAQLIEFLLWVIATVLVMYVIYRYRKFIKFPLYTQKNAVLKNNKTKTLFGLDIRTESLPKNIPQQVEQLYNQGDHRQALSLLYRAMLSNLVHQKGFVFNSSFTEGECVSIVKQHNDQLLSSYTQDLTYCWQRVAYGHDKPDVSEVKQLCERWIGIFNHYE